MHEVTFLFKRNELIIQFCIIKQCLVNLKITSRNCRQHIVLEVSVRKVWSHVSVGLGRSEVICVRRAAHVCVTAQGGCRKQCTVVLTKTTS